MGCGKSSRDAHGSVEPVVAANGANPIGDRSVSILPFILDRPPRRGLNERRVDGL